MFQISCCIYSVQRIRKDESKYYEDLLEFGWKSLLLFPYHLSDVIITGLGVTPFHYYINMLDNQMAQEKSYDSLPNFTAADCLRLIGIGRNQYIDLMNSCRSNRRFGLFKKSARELLPNKPIGKWFLNLCIIHFIISCFFNAFFYKKILQSCLGGLYKWHTLLKKI